MLFFDKFFNPKSVAIIGASRTPGKLGYTILENLKSSFNGEIYPINPYAEKILGLMVYSSVLDVEEPIDHAVIVVPAEIVKKVIEEGIKKKIKAFTIISSGFSEIGEKERELELKELSDIMANEGVGVSKFISIGNKVDVDEIELIKYLEKDLSTRCIAIYLESVRNGSEFIKTAKKVTKTKPIVAFKAGKTEKGIEAVASHTGALAGSAQIYSAAFKQAGIIEAKSSEEIFDYAKVLANQPVLKNNKIAIVTDGGGFGIVATDAAIKCELELPTLENSSLKSLESFLPSYASTKNPIDITGDATVERYQKTLEIVLKDKNIAGVVCIALMQIPTLTDEIVDVLKDCKVFGKPITVCSAGSQYVLERNRKLERFGIPVYPTPERSVKALAILYEYGKILKRK